MNGGEEQNITAALNWHLFPNLRMQFNYSTTRMQISTTRVTV